MVTYTTEGIIRRTLGGVLGSGGYRDRGVCASCLVGLALERMHSGWRRSEIELAMEKVFREPGPLRGVPGGPCARCRRPTACLRGAQRDTNG